MEHLLPASLLADLENELIRFVFERYLGRSWRGEGLPGRFFQSLLEQVRGLSDGFTSERRPDLGHYLRPKEARSAYLLYFHLANVVRTFSALEEMHRRGLWPQERLRVLDLGSGSAPSLWAVALAAKRWNTPVEVVAAQDREKGFLSDARVLWDRFKAATGAEVPPLRTREADVFDARMRRNSQERFDLVIASNLLNELTPRLEGELVDLVRDLGRGFLAENGAFLLLEPALNRISRRLMGLRDQILAAGGVRAPIPCGHAGKCPLNAEPKDWCHFEVDWEAPPLRRRLEGELEHASGRLKYSYLLLMAGGEPAAEHPYRVLSGPLESRAGRCVLVCAPEQKVALYFDRNDPGTGKLMQSLRRGDLIDAKLPEKSPGKSRFGGYAREVEATAGMGIRRI